MSEIQTLTREKLLSNIKNFCKNVDVNQNNFYLIKDNILGQGMILEIMGINGIKKKPKSKPEFCFVRFFLSFYNENNDFIGSTSKTKPFKVSFNDNGYFDLQSQESIKFYFFNSEDFGKTRAVVEIVYLEINEKEVILEQSTEGWGYASLANEIKDKSFFNIFYGSPRNLLFKQESIKVEGASISYKLLKCPEINIANFLLPCYVALLGTDSKSEENIIYPGSCNLVAGLENNYFPVSLNQEIKLSKFKEIYIKNLELEITADLDYQISNYANAFFKAKSLGHQMKVNIRERKLKIGIHNAWKFINSTGKDNSTLLIAKDNFLFNKNVHCVDNFIENHSSNIGIIFELVYTIESSNNNIVYFTIGQGIYTSDMIKMDNKFSSIYLFTNGSTLNGEDMIPLKIDIPLRLNFIVSQNKDTFDKTYKEEEISKLKNDLETLKKSLAEELRKNLTSTNNIQMEEKIKYLENKLLINQKNLKTVYDKEDKYNFTITSSQNVRHLPNADKVKTSAIENQPINKLPSNIIIPPKLENNFNNVVASPVEVKSQHSTPRKIVDNPIVNENLNTFREDNKISNFVEPIPQKPEDNLNTYNDYNTLNFNNNNNTQTQVYQHPQEHYSNTINTNNLENLNLSNLNDLSKDMLVKIILHKELSLINQTQYPNNIQQQTLNRNLYYDTQVREISRKDKSELLSKGLILSDDINNENLIQYSLETEMKDEKKGANYLIHFIAYKPSKDQLLLVNDEKLKKLSFLFSFWDYEGYQTESAIITKPENKVYNSSIPFVLVKEEYLDDKNIKIKLSYDPINDQYTDFRDFINYLLSKHIFVQVFDNEKLFKIGYMKIPLKDFLRNAKSNKTFQKEYELYDYFTHSAKGSFLININIVGFTSKFVYEPLKFKQINSFSENNNLTKKKKVSVRPMNIDTLTKKEKEIIGNEMISQNNILLDNAYKSNVVNNKPIKLNVDPETQKKLRVMKYTNLINKKDKYENAEISHKLNNDKLTELKLKQDKEDKYFDSLTLAHKLKEIKKDSTIKTIIEENNKNHINITLIAGKPHYLNYVIKNQSNHEENFHAVVSNPIENKKNFINIENEVVKVINDEATWSYIVSTEKQSLIAPHGGDYNSISNENYFVLKAEEKMPLLIKLLSFDTSTNNKNFTIWIYKGKDPMEYLSITIVKVLSIKDHIFEFNLPDNRASLLNIPNPFKARLIHNNKEEDLTEQIIKNQVSTNSAYMLKEDPTTKNFIIKCKPGETNDNKSISFNIYLYKDDFRFNILSSWLIRINFLETIDIHSQLGTKINQRFFVETNERKTIQCFSSNQELVLFNEKYSVPIILIPDIPNEMKFIVYPKKKDNISEVIINVVDIANKEIIKSMLIRVIPEYPTFAHVVRIDCNVGSATHFKYEYTSKLNKWSIIKFESNDDDFLRIIDNTLNFNPRETKQISMVVPEQSQRGIAEEVILFISDSEELFSETILFQFHFK